jgi:hypothetical protein
MGGTGPLDISHCDLEAPFEGAYSIAYVYRCRILTIVGVVGTIGIDRGGGHDSDENFQSGNDGRSPVRVKIEGQSYESAARMKRKDSFELEVPASGSVLKMCVIESCKICT